MNIFDELNEEGQEALRNITGSLSEFPNNEGNALDAIAFSGSENRFQGVTSPFADSPFGVAWDAAIYKNDTLIEETGIPVDYVVNVSHIKERVTNNYDNEVVGDDVIKLYLVVHDKKTINYYQTSKEDLRLANIRYSNIAEIIGFVVGDNIRRSIRNDNRFFKVHIDKFVDSFTESPTDKVILESLLSDALTHYLENPRSSLFTRSFIGSLIKEELVKDLQQFWKPILTSLAREIRTLKLEDQKYWQPYTSSGDLKSDEQFTPVFPVAEAAQEVGLFFNRVVKQFEDFDLVINEYLEIDGLKSKSGVIVFEETSHNNILIKVFREIYSFFRELFVFVKEGLEGFIQRFTDAAYTLNAFFVGVYNGIINFVASLVDAIAFFAGLLSGDSEELFEAIHQEYQKLKEAGFFEYVYTQLGKFFDKVAKRYDTTQQKYLITKNLGEDIFAIFETIIGVIYLYRAGAIVANRLAGGIQALRKQVDDTIELSSRNIDDLDITLRFPENIRKFIKSARLIDDIAPKIIKNFEKIIKLEKIEFAFVWNDGKGFKNIRPFTSGSGTSVSIADAFGRGKALTRQRIRSLKNAIITHNHPNGSRFSNDDIRWFLELELKELRAIGDNGIVFSLKRKGKINKSMIDNIFDELEEQKSKIASDLILEGNRDFDKIDNLLEDFEEKFLLERINEFVEYTVFQ